MAQKVYAALTPFLKFIAVPLGFVFFVLGCVGVVLPLIPHTPFFILTALLWGYGSHTLYRWLHTLPVVGASLDAWNREGAVPLHAKVLSVVTLLIGALIAVSVGPWLWYRISVPAVLVCVLVFIVSRPRPSHQRREIVSVWVALVLWGRSRKSIAQAR
jgi:uncharacterized membrane protein YbaN (DUF454 family)